MNKRMVSKWIPDKKKQLEIGQQPSKKKNKNKKVILELEHFASMLETTNMGIIFFKGKKWSSNSYLLGLYFLVSTNYFLIFMLFLRL